MKKRNTTKDRDMWSVTMTREQLLLVNMAIEMYFRVHLNQMFDLADSLAFMNFDYATQRGEFDERIARRDDAKALFEYAYRRAIGSQYVQVQTEEMLNLEDIWAEIRYQLWRNREEPKPHDTVDSRPTLIRGTEPLVEVRRVDVKE